MKASADKDVAARSAIWKALLVAADDVHHRFRVGAVHGVNESPIQTGDEIPEKPTWQLVEALSLLGIILRAEDAIADVVNLFGKTGPIKIQEDGVIRYLWAQQTLRGERSALRGVPDLIVTSSSELPHPGNATRIIEAKCVKQLGTQTIRSEFGKAHDLRVTSYFIWSFYSPSPEVVSGAKGLGLDLQALGFDSDERAELLANPESLIYRVAYPQEEARKAQRFAGVLEESAGQVRQKLLGPSQ